MKFWPIIMIQFKLAFKIVPYGPKVKNPSTDNSHQVILWKMLNLHHQHNNHTTTLHMRVNPTHWGPHSCEWLLCGCCDGVVYESNPLYYSPQAKYHLLYLQHNRKRFYQRYLVEAFTPLLFFSIFLLLSVVVTCRSFVYLFFKLIIGFVEFT